MTTGSDRVGLAVPVYASVLPSQLPARVALVTASGTYVPLRHPSIGTTELPLSVLRTVFGY